MSEFGDSKDSFAGRAFHHSFKKGTSPGVIRVGWDSIAFEFNSGAVELPLDNLSVNFGGAGDRSIVFRHPSYPDWTIVSDDQTILRHRVLSRNRGIANRLGRIRSRKRRIKVFLCTLPLLLCLAVYGLVLSKEPLVRYLTSKIPISWEQKLGDAIFTQITATTTLIEGEEAQTLLKRITEPVVGGVRSSPYEFKFHVAKNPTINAFAIPGGHIVIHSGLISLAETPEEIAGVLAHEIAHITLRHSLRQLVSSAGVYLTVQAVFGDIGGLLGVIAENSAFLLTQKFSRDHEREADDRGWSYLLQAKINPQGMITFFKKLDDERARSSSNGASNELEESLAFLSTHPTTDERIELLQKKLGALDKSKGFITFNLDLKELKEHVQN